MHPRPLKVFLSHAHADATHVRALHNRLVADGVDSWLDKEKLIPGQDWEREIRKAVREADVVIVCLSKKFNERGYRQKEVRIALDEAKMMPEGEIFIIPAKLEECDNLESLSNIHWVDLFEDDGYEKLKQSLRLRADKVKALLEITDDKREADSISTVIDGLNWGAVNGSTVFHRRLSDSFPGLRGHQRFEGKEACERLELLLREPLNIDVEKGQETPFWWLRGISNMFITKFERLDDERILMNINQLHINFIEAVRSFTHPEKNFVYIQTYAEPSIGIHENLDFSIDEYLEEQLEKGYGYYLNEEYGVWQNSIITREEYDDGAAIIQGKPIKTREAMLRVRYVTPYNLVICGNDHVLNSSLIDFDVTKLLNEILLGKKNIDDLIEYIRRLPKRSKNKNAYVQ